MSKIGFLTDSCSDIPQELADKYGIEVVGFPINLDGTEYMERKDFTNDQFYEMMRKAQGVPTTAAITQLQWCEIYERYVDEGYTDLVHLSINAAGSSTYNNAIKGAEMLAEERPDHKLKIQIIDSHTYSMPLRLVFLRVRPQGAQRRRAFHLCGRAEAQAGLRGDLPGGLQPEADEEVRPRQRCRCRGGRPAGHPSHHQPERRCLQGRGQGAR